ncbi:MAG: diaminopimelate epimerase [Gammaproteobacteria bacterium]|nr:diaminopimelate epimerase [Gammaproteobacteria bacterium]
MLLKFTKMHGLGNDFIVIDAVRQQVSLSAEQIRLLADRHFGVGCDQLLLVEPPQSQDAEFRYRIFNADGGEVEQCGNGARCFAQFVREQGLSDANDIVVETAAGLIRLSIETNGQVTVNMGVPRFAPRDLPFTARLEAMFYSLDVAGQTIRFGIASMGNPHAVIVVDDIQTAPVLTLGAALEKHIRFPKRVNVGFMQIVNEGHIKLRVFERGAGETLACGTGACAAVAVGRRRSVLADRVQVDLPGGILNIMWRGDNEPVLMTGPATTVFAGEIDV